MATGLAPDDPLPALLERCRTSAHGLSTTEANLRLSADGPNEVAARSMRTKLESLVRWSTNPLVLILLAAGIASAFAGEPVDAVIIGVIVLLSATVNAWQTLRSTRAVSELQAQIAATALVSRDGVFVEIPRRTIVVGDVIQLAAGDMVPADARLLEATDLHVQQSALTGESLPTEKRGTAGALTNVGPDSPHLVYLGSSIVSGSARAVVFATGAGTAFGDIVARLASTPDETEFDRGMKKFGLLILETVLVLVMFILIVNVSLGRDPLQSLLFSVALAVGLTPEFLPMITTVTLAQGAVQMARAKVIVKHLSSIQNLGSIDVLCSDKTGTLTAGTMTFDASLDVLGHPATRALELAWLNSRFETGIKSPLDTATLACTDRASEGFTKTGEVPFDFDRRRVSVVVEKASQHLLVTKGAPESVIEACTRYEQAGVVHVLDRAAAERAQATFRALSEQGFRVLAVAYRDTTNPAPYTVADEHELTLVGFVTFADHLLDGIASSLAQMREDGIAIKIVTGDNELVSRHICEQVGLEVGAVVLGTDIEHLDELALARVAERTTLFARVSPAQKHRIIRALRTGGHVVGFLGDGINDAPSLHGSDVGISVAGAVDVAREASDIILLERRLDVLHAGIIAGRRASENVRKYLLMGTSSNFGNMLSMAVAAIFLPFLPMLPAQILLNNFLYDVAQLTIPTDRVDRIHTRTPQRWDIHVIRRFMLIVGPVSSAFDVLTFVVLLHVFHFHETLFQTGWFVESLATQTLVLFVIRTAGRPWRDRPSTPLILTTLTVVAIGSFLPYSPLAAMISFAPLPATYALFVIAVVGSYLAIVELVKGLATGAR